jgi:dihydrofolate reductase
MGRLIVFESISVDGYFTDANNDLSWAHNVEPDPEFNQFVANNASGKGGVMVFGRKTYEMMASFWPTENAIKTNPIVADSMNSRAKIVFSKTLKEATWNNTTLLRGDLTVEIKKLKEKSDVVILGSGTLVARLAEDHLVDEYQMVVLPIALGSGRTMFDGMKTKMSLQLTKSHSFKNGNVFLVYHPR